MNQRFAGKPRNCSNGGQTTSWIKAEVLKLVLKGTGRSSNVVHLKAISSVAFSLRNVCFHVFVVILKFLIWIGTLRLGPVLPHLSHRCFISYTIVADSVLSPPHIIYHQSHQLSTLSTVVLNPNVKDTLLIVHLSLTTSTGAVQWCEHSHVVNTRIFSVCVWYDCSSLQLHGESAGQWCHFLLLLWIKWLQLN